MASSCRALSSLLLRRAPSMEEAVGKLSLDTVCKVSAGACGVSPYKVAPRKVPAVVRDLPSPTTSVISMVQEENDKFDPDAHYPEPAESLKMLAPLQISGFASDPVSVAAFGSQMPHVEADYVIYLDYKPSISPTTSVISMVQEEHDKFDPYAKYPKPAESLNMLVPLKLTGFASDAGSPTMSPAARRFAAFRSQMPDVEADTVLYLDYKPSLSTNKSSMVAVGADQLLAAQGVPRMAEGVQIPRVSRSLYLLPKGPSGSISGFCPSLSRVSRSPGFLPKSALGYSASVPSTNVAALFGSRFFSTQKEVSDDHGSKLDEFLQQYQTDRVFVSTGISLIVKDVCVLKDEVDQLKDEVEQGDFVEKWLTTTAKDTFHLSDGQVEAIGHAWNVLTYCFSAVGIGSLLFSVVKTVQENDVPCTDYLDLLNAVRSQALQRGVTQYKVEREAREAAEKEKALQVARVKKAADEAAAVKKAKEAEVAASRKSKLELARAKAKMSKSYLAAAARQASQGEVRAAKLAKWRQENAQRKAAAVARKVKFDLASAERKRKEKEAAAKRKAKADKLAADVMAAAAARKAKAAAAAAARQGAESSDDPPK